MSVCMHSQSKAIFSQTTRRENRLFKGE